MNYELVVENIGNVYTGGDRREARKLFKHYVQQVKDEEGRAESPVTLFLNNRIIKEWYEPIKLPTLKELTTFIVELKKSIADDYRSEGQEDDTPQMDVTVGANKTGAWSYQTGDNSYTGGAYGFPHWAVVTIHRRSNSREVAHEIQAQLKDLMYQ